MHQVLLGVGLAIAGLLGAVTLNRRGERPENVFLAGWLIAYAISFFGWICAIMLSGLPALLSSATASSALMTTPALSWMYARLLAGRAPGRIWPHFIPPAFNFGIIALLAIFSAAQNINGAVIVSGPAFLSMLLLLPSFVILAMCAYAVSAWNIAGEEKAALKAMRSDESVAAFDWVRVWAATTLALLLTFLVLNTLVNAGLMPLGDYLTVTFAAVTAQVLFVTYHGLKENVVLAPSPKARAPSAAAAPNPQRASALAAFMVDRKPHLDSTLTIDALADAIGWDRAEVADAIRQSDANFFDYVNRHRVEAAKDLLLARENISISVLAIGFDAGFGSKSSFNAAFKKATGQTPTQFRRSAAQR